MAERACWFVLSRNEIVQCWATLNRDELINLIAKFTADRTELAETTPPAETAALVSAFNALVQLNPDGLYEYLVELTDDKQEVLEVEGWRIVADDQAETAADQLPEPWEDDPAFPMADWRYEVANGAELRGYRDWVAQQRQLHALEE